MATTTPPPVQDAPAPAPEKQKFFTPGVLIALGIIAVCAILWVMFPPPASAERQLVAVALLVFIFAVAMWRDISMGVVAFPVAFIAGQLYFHMTPADITKGFPGSLVTTLIGVTYLFGVARSNGTIKMVVRWMVGLVHGKINLIPWVFFLLAALITAAGALSIATYAILIPLGMSFCRTNKISPVMMGLSILNGTNAGGFSPIALYWIVVKGVLTKNGIEADAIQVFIWTFIFNVLLNLFAQLVFAGKFGDKLGINPTHVNEEAAAEAAALQQGDAKWQPIQIFTLLLFLCLVVGAVFFSLDVGLAAFVVALILAIIDPVSGKKGTSEIGWGVVLLIAGIVTFINMLDNAKVITEVANTVAGFGTPITAALLMLVVAALVSAFASTNAMFVVLVPLAAPLLTMGKIDSLGFVIALCLSASVVDSSPFSTAGALMLANTEDYLYDKTMKWLMVWAFAAIPIAPLITWLVFVVTRQPAA